MSNRLPHVNVMMSSYNGEKYIAKQIESILEQIDVTLHLYIRDDGSTDKTKEIINEYHEEYPEVISVVLGENIGFSNSFMYLVEHSSQSDFYAFADQDDLWEPDKLSKAVDAIAKEDIAVLYGSNLKAFDTIENRVFYIYNRNSLKSIKEQFNKYIFISNPHGCTMLWNQKLQNELIKRKKPDILTHDVWVNLVARCTGKVFFDLEHSYINYRLHGSNTCGATPQSFFLKLKKYYFFYFRDGKKLNIAKVCETICKEFPEKETNLIRQIAKYDNSIIDFFRTIRMINKMEIHLNSKFKYICLVIFKKL